MVLARRFIERLDRLIDPRYYVGLNHTLLILLGLYYGSIQRTYIQIGFAIVVAVITELVMSRLTMKQKQFIPYDRLVSSIVLALGAIILIRAPYDWWFYGFITFIGVISKYLILNPNGRHIYNPTNVAIVFAVGVLPEHLVYRPDTFYGDNLMLFVVATMGVLATIRANSWRASLAYFLGIVCIGAPVGQLFGFPWLLVIGVEMSIPTMIFALLMLTDPQTCPRAPKEQWAFGLMIAIVNLVFRYYEIYYSQFLALFLVLSFGCVLFKSSGSYIGKKTTG